MKALNVARTTSVEKINPQDMVTNGCRWERRKHVESSLNWQKGPSLRSG